MNQGYFTVKGETENLILIERSKFICNIAHVEDELQAKAYVETIRKRPSVIGRNESFFANQSFGKSKNTRNCRDSKTRTFGKRVYGKHV